jgi:hypothetical protein
MKYYIQNNNFMFNQNKNDKKGSINDNYFDGSCNCKKSYFINIIISLAIFDDVKLYIAHVELQSKCN